MEEVNNLIAGREILSIDWSRDGMRMRVIVEDGNGEERMIFEGYGGVFRCTSRKKSVHAPVVRAEKEDKRPPAPWLQNGK